MAAVADRRLAEAALARGDWLEAANRFELVRSANGVEPPILMALAQAYAGLGRRPESMAALRATIALSPGDGGALHALALLLFDDGAFTAAADAASRSIAVDRTNVTWLNALGAALIDAEDPARAATVLSAALALDPYHQTVMVNCAKAFAQLRRYDTAAAILDRNLLRLFGPSPDSSVPITCNSLMLRHDAEQTLYLLARGVIPSTMLNVVARDETILSEIGRNGIGHRTFEVVPSDLGPTGSMLGRFLYRRRVPRAAGTALSPSWDRGRISEQFAAPPGICWIDGFLSAEALGSLRAFCLESTIWHDISHNYQDSATPRGYLGAYPSTGFTAPLLYQIADELSRALPAVFGDHSLRQMWSYKYEADLEGIDVHGDDAAVNVNFWITPDEANLDPDRGGLVVYPIEAPRNWRFDDINRDQEKIRRFLSERRAVPVNVPYRQNRAVIFNSDLFHATARTRFKPGYENRRINVTMLFGRRHD